MSIQSPVSDVVDFKDTKKKVTNRLDQILIEQKAKGENYADWQKARYPIKAERPQNRNSYM